MGTTRGKRALLVVLLLLAAQLVALAWPAYACGCGGLVPGQRSRIAVGQETSAVRWDGRTEQIVMRLTVTGNAKEAAWVMPVPHRATVRLGDRELFAELERLTAPEERERHYFWPRSGDWPFDEADGLAGAPSGRAPGVGVVGRERLGPFDVARLTASDPGALSGWLRENGFALPGRMSAELEPYVERKWEYVAVRLAPEAEDGVLGGALDPLHLTFASDRFVYPMRLSRAAGEPQHLSLYVLAAHRMRPRGDIGGERPELTFAGRVGDAGGAVGRLARGEDFLTAWDQRFPVPGRISGDHELRRSGTDAAFRQVTYDDELLVWGGVPAWLITVLVVLLGAAAVVVLLIRRRVRGAGSPTGHGVHRG